MLISEIYYSLVPWGSLVGRGVVIVKSPGEKEMSDDELVQTCARLMPEELTVMFIGVPSEETVAKLRGHGAFIIIQGDGPIKGGDWTIQVPENQLKGLGDEVIWMMGERDEIPEEFPSGVNFLCPDYAGDQPIPGALRNCIRLIKKNPNFLLTMKYNYTWGIQ